MIERKLEDYLFDNPTKVPNVTCWLARQFRIPSGRIDLLGISKSCHYSKPEKLTPYVVELKCNKFTHEALTQVSRYARDIDIITSNLDVYRGQDYKEYWESTHKIVIAPGIPSEAIIYEADSLEILLYSVDDNYQINSGYWIFTSDTVSNYHNMLFNIAGTNLFRDAEDKWLKKE
jgi:hypothetical protein